MIHLANKFGKQSLIAIKITVVFKPYLLVGQHIPTAVQGKLKSLYNVYPGVAGGGQLSVSSAFVASDNVIFCGIGRLCALLYQGFNDLFVRHKDHTVVSAAHCAKCLLDKIYGSVFTTQKMKLNIAGFSPFVSIKQGVGKLVCQVMRIGIRPAKSKRQIRQNLV